jgi:hypothetical protein|tara:strand:+ start:235 stop:651 length:417 start_codon:yes stop_codon:yes gene_type:complete
MAKYMKNVLVKGHKGVAMDWTLPGQVVPEGVLPQHFIPETQPDMTVRQAFLTLCDRFEHKDIGQYRVVGKAEIALEEQEEAGDEWVFLEDDYYAKLIEFAKQWWPLAYKKNSYAVLDQIEALAKQGKEPEGENYEAAT